MSISKISAKILSLTLILIMLLTMTACGTKDPNQEISVDEEVVSEYNETKAAEVYGSFASEVETLYKEEHPELYEDENKVQNDYDVSYLSWTYFEYATAKESEKDNCVKAYLGYIGDLVGLPTVDYDAETLASVKESLAKALKNNEELSVKEIVLYFYASQDTSDTE